MTKRLSTESIKFKESAHDPFGFTGNIEYDVYHSSTLIGKLLFTPLKLIFTTNDIKHEEELPFGMFGRDQVYRSLEYMKGRLIDMYHESRGDLLNDLLSFKHRDPDRIGNGLHDYDVYYNGMVLGTLIFPNFIISSHPHAGGGIDVLFSIEGDNMLYTLPANTNELSKLSSNEDILDKMRSTVITIITENKSSKKE